MRPLVVDLGREYRGGQHQALLLLRGLQERGHVPGLITIQDSLLARRAKEAGIAVHGVQQGRRRIAAALRIRRLARGKEVDLVHANEPHALTSAWLARAYHSVPLVAARRIALPLSPGFMSLARYHSAARIVAVSRFVQQSVIESGIPANRSEVIYDGVDIPQEISGAERHLARARLGIPPDCLCIGNVAAMVPEKGHELLLRAFAKLREAIPGCALLLCGEGPEHPKLRQLAMKLNLPEAVKFAGPISNIRESFAAMDVFAFPSHEEPLGSALLAAMAHALPVVAIGRGGIPEIVEHGTNGLLVDRLDPDALAAAIVILVENPAEAHRLCRAGRETISARFSSDRMVDQTVRLYERLAGER